MIWDTATGKLLRDVPFAFEENFLVSNGSTMDLVHAAFAPDGERMTVWLGTQVGIQEVTTGCLLTKLPKGVGAPMAFSPDGRLVAATILQPRKDWTEGSVVKGLSVIETVSGEQVYRLERGGFQYVAFARDSLSLIVADNKHLGIWDTTVGARLHRMAWPESVRNVRGKTKIRSLAALPGGRAATGMSDGDILIWDLAVSTWPKRKPVGDLSREGLAAL